METQLALKEYDTVRLRVIERTLSGLTVHEAAVMLKLSVRQGFRLKARVRAAGQQGAVHGNRGRRPANAKPRALRDHVIELRHNEYPLYNACHLSETLEEERDIKLNRETLRCWMRAAGIPAKRRHRYRGNHRRKRERRARLGEMAFLDGSPHRWFGPGHPKCTLILQTDDATGRPLYGGFYEEETLNGCFEVLYHAAKRHGLPGTLYLDRAGQFTTTRHGGIHRFQRDDQPTHFEIAMQTLAVELIFANSPQARGRGERINQSLQDRLVAELDHHHITDPAKATADLNRVFIPKYARRFGVKPRNTASGFRPIPKSIDLRTVLCAKNTREVANDNTISYQGHRYQLKHGVRSICIAGTRITVQQWFDGTIHIRHKRVGEIPHIRLCDQSRPERHSARSGHDTFAVASV